MITAARLIPGLVGLATLRRGVSAAALSAAMLAAPGWSQTAQMLRSTAGLTAPVVTPQATLPVLAVTPNQAGLNSASARAIANQARVASAVSLAQQANAAARAAAPVLGVPNGLVLGGLVPVGNPTSAALDATGLKTWQGAAAPTQATADGKTTVTVTQTDARALLSWSSFNVGRDTVLNFVQQPDWVVVNRIVSNIDPLSGRLIDPINLKPSTILGQINGAGTVLVLNQNGILFGASAQVNTRSFLATSLELGALGKAGATAGSLAPTTLSDRSNAFLQNGLLGGTGEFLSAIGVQRGAVPIDGPTREGGVTVQAGAAITGGDGGFVIIAAPQVVNAGQLTANNGQVSLQSGRRITAVASTGAADSADPNVRGLVLTSSSSDPLASDGVTNSATGIIASPRGLISLGATSAGSVVQNGVLTSTTSVSRNGKIALTGSTVTVGPLSVIAITPDSNGETIPLAASSVASFKHSVIDIGGANSSGAASPSVIAIGANALIYAPSAVASIGGTTSVTSVDTDGAVAEILSSVTVDSGATIDVGGVKDLLLPASRNSVKISPVKRNELRDTPNYREVSTDGSFTLNGTTLYIDARLSGVRSDGVAWIGSPLIEAGSAVAQIGATAAELMTGGGTLTLGARNAVQGSTIPAGAVTVRAGATLDVSGGWVRYAGGIVQTSRLQTADGRIVEIGRADPNDNFVALVDPISVTQDRFGITDSFGNPLATDPDFQLGYIEGHDAGALVIKASTNVLSGAIYGQAFAGTQQIARAREASAAATIQADTRLLQSTPLELPSGALFKIQALAQGIGTLSGGADIIVYHGGAAPVRTASTIQLSDGLLSNNGFAAVALQTSGAVSLLAGSDVELAPNGGLTVDAGRSILFAGTVRTPSGAIRARTYELLAGSVFRTDDDLPMVLAADAATPRLLDITVTGTLSARGRFTNDALVTDGAFLGSAYADGGSISLTVAPRVLIPIGDTPIFAADASGSIFVRDGSLLDVSAGGSVKADGTPLLTASGGSVSLINQTTYFQLQPSAPRQGAQADFVGIDLPTFRTPLDDNRLTSASPKTLVSTVTIAPATIRGQGFTGGGQFTLVTPDLNFGAHSGVNGTAIPLDFTSTSGFASFNFTTYSTRLLGNVFDNGAGGTTALLDTEVVRIGRGETLSLSRAFIPSLLDSAQTTTVRALVGDSALNVALGSAVPVDAYDRRGVALTFGGLTELALDAGGRIDGADGAALTSSVLVNAGTIRLPGGTVRQVETLPFSYLTSSATSGALAVQNLSEIFGAANADGLFDPNAPNALGIRSGSGVGATVLSNVDLVTSRSVFHPVYLLADTRAGQGVVLQSGSTTDLSGISIRNPRAASVGVLGRQRIDGRLITGGTLEAAAAFAGQGSVLFDTPQFGIGRYVTTSAVTTQRAGLTLEAGRGSVVDISGVADTYDIQTSLGVYAPSAVWSNGGALTLGAGGTISGATVRADGGAAQAEGGILNWLNPVLRQSDGTDRSVNFVSADSITAAGFDTFVAQQSLTGSGAVSLSLGRGFYLTNRTFNGTALVTDYGASVSASGALSITAPYIRLSSLDQTVLARGDLAPGLGTVTFNAGALDISGSVYFDPSVRSVRLLATGDVRVSGVQPTANVLLPASGAAAAASLSGQLTVGGDLLIRSAQLYPTTGTGNLQRAIDAQRNGTSLDVDAYLIASTGAAGTIRFERSTPSTPAVPYSAGGNLIVQAANIEQAGVIRVPIGKLVLGSNTPGLLSFPGNTLRDQIIPATTSLKLLANSITAVSAGGLSIPYGTTTDLTEYFFAPTSASRLFAPPAAELRLGGDRVIVDAAATVDLSGGGELYAYEFASGVGGSRDVLSRFNSDQFSSRNGLQFADGRQVYAIVPSLANAQVALADPVYSADYSNLYAPSDAGRQVYLEGGSGIAAGWYTLLPAQYALLPGGLRIVENSGQAAGAVGIDATLRDGSMIIGGHYGIAGTALEESTRRSFTVESQASFRKFSRIELTSASTTFSTLATRDTLVVPQLPADAARLVLSPLSELSINTKFLAAPAAGGRGGQVDITGSAFEIVTAGTSGTLADAVILRTSDFANLNAASLLIGGTRTDFADGTTALAIGARTIRLANGAGDPLSAPEIVLAVDGQAGTKTLEDGTIVDIPASSITVADGSAIVATSTLADTRAGAYVIQTGSDQTAVGGVIRVANGPERLVVRPGATAIANSLTDTSIVIGSANGTRGVTLTGTSVLLDSSRDLVIYDNPATAAAEARITATNLALGGDDVIFSATPSGFRGLTITPAMEALFAQAQRLTIASKSIVAFSGGVHNFNDLVLDVRGIRPFRPGEPLPVNPYEEPFPPGFDPAATPLPALDPAVPIAVTIRARDFSLSNSDIDRGACGQVVDVNACGTAGNSLFIDAVAVHLGSGAMRTYGFDGAVRIAASTGIFAEGAGRLDVNAAPLALETPFLGDRALVADPRGVKVQPDLTIATGGALSIANPRGLAAPTVAAAPGATLDLGDADTPLASLTIDGARIRASAGTLAARSLGTIAVTGAAVLETPSYAKTFGDAADAVTVSAPGGTLSLVSLGGNVALGTATRLSIGGTSGEAGTLQLSAAKGFVTLGGAIDASAPGGHASLRLDTGGALDLASFLIGKGAPFSGDIAIRTGTGDLRLTTGQALSAQSVRLTADGGSVAIAGSIDTSGISGGDIGLFGTGGVALAATAKLDAHANGYAATDTRVASGGTVDLGTSGAGVIGIANGAVIDVAARRPGARLVAAVGKDAQLNDTTVYRYSESDTGGLVRLRAPLIEQAGADSVAIDFAGTISGARQVSVEAVKRFDLTLLGAGQTCGAAAVCINATGQAVLDLNATPGSNILADDIAGGVVRAVRGFDIGGAATRLGSLTATAGYIARPGIELDFGGDIVLASNWNLGAAKVDEAGATAAGLFTANRALGNNSIAVVAGSESRIYSEFSNFFYRVGGRADGAASVLTLRAGGNLDIRGSITDGFFTFGDQTDPAYLSYQLGGGDRLTRPVINIACGVDRDCSVIGDFAVDARPNAPAPSQVIAINLNLAALTRGTAVEGLAPYSAAANSPGARGSQASGAGDPIGSAVLAPLLTGGAAADSTSYRLVAGAKTASADVLQVAPSSTGSVSVSGEVNYKVEGVRGQPRYDGALQFVFNTPGQTRGLGAVNSDNIYDSYNETFELDDPNQLARLAFGQAPAAAQAFIRSRATAFFSSHPGEYQFFGPAGARTIVTAGFQLLTQFIASIDADFSAGLANGTLGYAPLAPFAPTQLSNVNAYARSLVRTGSGSIDVAAASDVDLRNGATAIFRNSQNRASTAAAASAAQVGGTAIYTAGVRTVLGPVPAGVAGTGQTLTIDTAAAADLTRNNPAQFMPSFDGVLMADAVYARGGGSVSVSAGRDVLARRDVWSEAFRADDSGNTGAGTQLWRLGAIGNGAEAGLPVGATNIRINAQLFSSGVGALGGGNVGVTAGRDVRELTAVSDTSISSGLVADPGLASPAQALATFGGGNVDVAAGRDLLGGSIDVAAGIGTAAAGRAVASSGLLRQISATAGVREDNLLRLRVTDATIDVTATHGLDVGGITALGTRETPLNAAGFYTAVSGVSLRTDGAARLFDLGADVLTIFDLRGDGNATVQGALLPGSLGIAALFGDIQIDGRAVLYPSAVGQLRLFAGGDLAPVTLSMDDGDPSLAPGALSGFGINSDLRVVAGTRRYGFPVTLPTTSDAARRLFHNPRTTHAGDAEPVRIAVEGAIDQLALATPKATRISAGGDLIDTVFIGQNLAPTDVTRITAGRDIVATSRVLPVATGTGTAQLPVLQGNTFALGGPGTLFVEAGRDLGPFLNSATVSAGTNVSYAGGIITVGNDYNPWLGAAGAKIYAEFGVAGGADYDALRDTYVDPANIGKLDGDLFVQTTDANGNPIPDRTKPIYAPILINYIVTNFADRLRAAYGTTAVTSAQAYSVFKALPALVQRQFLLDSVYFNELAAPARPDGPSLNQFVRSYRAVDLLFPASRGYTANDLSGASNGGAKVATGNLDLRLATIETQRGGDITILGPGGRAVAGSIVSTSVQAARRGEEVTPALNLFFGSRRDPADNANAARILSIPIGYEGVLTLRGGAVHGFTDGDFLLNQSRLFTQAGGNITLFSSNGDLNAGQGPRSAANFPPVVLRFTPNGFSEVDSAGAIAGAGIAAFQPRPDIPAPDVILVAPAGTVDAGDAGVRAAGNVFVAAAQVANADAISAGGKISGSGAPAAVDTGAAASASAAGAAGAAAAAAVNPQGVNGGDRTRITVDVLGFGGDPNDDPCKPGGNAPRPANCPVPTTTP